MTFAALAAGLAALACGCHFSVPFSQNESLGPALPDHAGVEEVVQRVNANIERLQAWRSSDLRISGRSLPVHLTGHIAVERPRNFRLTAGALGMTDEADFGSNSEWFWFWVRRGQPNYVFRARHDDMEHSDVLRQMIPFQPDWLIEALGVLPIDPRKVTRLDPGDRQTVNLTCDLLLPSGQPVKKVIRVDSRHGVVLGHYLYDASGKLIAKADLDKHEIDRAKGVVMPHLITLEWPQANLQISLELGQIEINPGELPGRIWEVPNKEPMYGSFDIGARTRARSRNWGQQQPGRARLDGQRPAAMRDADASSFENEAGPNGPGGERPAIDADNSAVWNKPLEAPDDASGQRSTRPAARVFTPASSESASSGQTPTPSSAAAAQDPFAAEPSGAGSPAATGELIETPPR